MPGENAVFQCHEAVGGILLGEGHRAGVEIGVCAAVPADGDVNVAAQEIIAGLQRRGIVGPNPVAVGGADGYALQG